MKVNGFNYFEIRTRTGTRTEELPPTKIELERDLEAAVTMMPTVHVREDNKGYYTAVDDDWLTLDSNGTFSLPELDRDIFAESVE
jgi:hypothetical protein